MGVGSSSLSCCKSDRDIVDIEGKLASDLIGPPRAVVFPPGQCVFTDEFKPAKLINRTEITHDSFIFTFELPDKKRPLGLSTCACILSMIKDPVSHKPVVRPYTPVSTNDLLGSFQLLVKVYPQGIMSQHLKTLKLGAALDFKHTRTNVKVQYPFNRKYITMLAAGTGVTPMIQALHAILGTPHDDSKVNLICGNKTQEDILCYDLLENWAVNSNGRLTVSHILSRAEKDTEWQGARGLINREIIEANSVGPCSDVLIMVCGPPAMYDALCGPRDKREVSGVLSEMGYTYEQVVKL